MKLLNFYSYRTIIRTLDNFHEFITYTLDRTERLNYNITYIRDDIFVFYSNTFFDKVINKFGWFL